MSPDADTVRRLLAAMTPVVRIHRVRFYGEGWDNRLFLVNDDLIVRVARTSADSIRLLAEARVLRAIAPRLSLAIPIPKLIHEPDERFPFAAMVYRLIPGEPLGQDVDSLELADSLTAFLEQLHAIPIDLAREIGLPVYDAAAWLERHQTLVDQTKPALRLALESNLYLRFCAWWAAYRDGSAATAFEPCFVHGDLGHQHVLVTRDPLRVSGVIDFGDAMVADPALDLAGIPDRLAREVARRLIAEPDRESFWRRCEAYRRLAPLHAVLTGQERDDQRLLREGLEGIQRLFGR